MNTRDDVLVWVDLEMTGLDPETCAIVEIGMILTDRNLDRLADPFEVAVWQPESVLESMGPFVRKMHEKSGLLTKIRNSTVTLDDAEQQVLAIVTKHASHRTARLCGNSVWQDRRFLSRYMPAFERYLHYRQIDVTSIKEVGEWWYGKVYNKPAHREHTALFDIEQSIEELKFLRGAVMK